VENLPNMYRLLFYSPIKYIGYILPTNNINLQNSVHSEHKKFLFFWKEAKTLVEKDKSARPLLCHNQVVVKNRPQNNMGCEMLIHRASILL
jgi:hypothetical protein